MSKKMLILLAISVTMLLTTGCADVTLVTECVAGAHTYGFWGGLWHGLVLPFSFFGQLFSDNIAMYAVANNGGFYNFGFWLGACVFGAGTSTASSSRR